MQPTRFVTDASLELIARRLRVLGFDVVVHRGARLDELFEAAERERRTVLTLSARHPARFTGVAAHRFATPDPAAAVRAIADAYAPSGEPWSRCTRCNHALAVRSSFEALGELPARVARAGGPLRHCPSCGQWYWNGSHVTRLRAWLESALARPVPLPAASAGAESGPREGRDAGPSGR